jgi:hypothetical protein
MKSVIKSLIVHIVDKGPVEVPACVGGDIDLLLNERCIIGCFPWRFVDGESPICRIVAFVEDDRYEELIAKKAACQLTRFGDATGVCRQIRTGHC